MLHVAFCVFTRNMNAEMKHFIHRLAFTFSLKKEIEIENYLLGATSYLSREIDLKCPCLVRCRGSVQLSRVILD